MSQQLSGLISLLVTLLLSCYILHADSKTLLAHLSTKAAQQQRGQLLTAFTFSGSPCRVQYELTGKWNLPPILSMFPMGTRSLPPDVVESVCISFFSRALSNATLKKQTGDLPLGSFGGTFPVVLVYSDQLTCKGDILPSLNEEVAIKLTLLNPGDEQLSASLSGLRQLYVVLIIFYFILFCYALWFIRANSLCRHHRTLESSNWDATLPSTVGKRARHNEWSYCGQLGDISLKLFTNCSVRTHGRAVSEHPVAWISRLCHLIFSEAEEAAIRLITMLIFFQFCATILSWLDLRRIENAEFVFEKSNPAGGADGLLSHFAELTTLSSHFILLLLLLVWRPQLEAVGYGRQHMRADSLALSSSAENGVAIPAVNHSRRGSANKLWPVSAVRFVSFFYILQVVYYLWTEGLSPHLSAASKWQSWPSEEEHAFWAGLGLPNWSTNGQLHGVSSKASLSGTKESTHSYETSPTPMRNVPLIVGFLLLILRTFTGFVCTAFQLRSSQQETVPAIRELYKNFALLTFLWFAAHPMVCSFAILFSDHRYYKVVIYGVSLIQLSCSALLLRLFTTRGAFWDVGALSSSLPRLGQLTGLAMRTRAK